MGGARISTVHGNFIVNTGGAAARDVLGLIELVRRRVRETYQIELETELKYVGS
jgi:UDP-N-acetylmuramate dehydrogenase